MGEGFPTVLDRALTRLKAGEAVEVILDDYPAHRDELGPFLAAAQELLLLPQVPPSPEPEAGLETFLAAAEALRSAPPPRPLWQRIRGWLAGIRGTRLHRAIRLALGVLSVMLLLFGLLTGTAALSRDSLPGDLFYPLKLAGEEMRLATIIEQAARAKYHLLRARTRAKEIHLLVLADRPLYEATVTRMNSSLQASLLAAASVSLNEPTTLLAAIEETTATQSALLASIETRLTSDEARRIVDLAHYGLARAQFMAQAGQADLHAFRLNVLLGTFPIGSSSTFVEDDLPIETPKLTKTP